MKKNNIQKLISKIEKNGLNIIVVFALIIIIYLLNVLGIININYITRYKESNNTIDTMSYNITKGEYIVKKVVDGDTFVINYDGIQRKVRLIGIDTAESVHPDESRNTEAGKEVSEYSKKVLENNIVSLEFDVQKEDKYGRLLAYVYLENGEMYNKLLLKEGKAKLATYPPNVKYVDEFTKLQKEAREKKIGVWSDI